MSALPGLLLSLLVPAGGSGIDPAALFSPDTFVYMHTRHPAVSRFMRTSFSPGTEMSASVAEFYETLEIAAGWELGILPEDMERLRDRLVLHQAVFWPEGDTPFEQPFELVIEGIPAEKLPARDRAPRQGFYGETAYAIQGDLVLAANDRGRLERMLRRARGEERTPSLLEEPAFRRAREIAGSQKEFYFSPIAGWKQLVTSQLRS
ncbi:MAG: hypothetical protein ACREIU_02200, partial [Planctomycetota bacterium]